MRIRGGRTLLVIALSVVFLFAAVISIAVCWSVYVQPVLRDIEVVGKFKQTNCTVVSVSRSRKDCSEECVHGYACPSTLPCIQINVNYLADINETMSSVIYNDLQTLTSDPACSLPLSCTNQQNRSIQELISNFTAKWGNIGSSYMCLYNSEELDQVILKVDKPDKLVIFNVLFWPLCVILASTVVCALSIYRRQKIQKRYMQYVERLGLNEVPSNVVYRRLEISSGV